MQQALYAPGARVVIRDCEWIVRRADRSDDGGYILTVDGLSELVNGKSARFLTRLEEQARQLPPTTLGHPRTHRRSAPGVLRQLHPRPHRPGHLPGGPTERTVEYIAPFFKPDREEDYRVAWEIFENTNQERGE